MRFREIIVYQVVLVVVGAFIVFVGLNVGLGGIQTMGWQVPSGFVGVTNAANFLVQDSHVRFLGGLFGAVGVFMIIGATQIKRYHAELRLVFVLIFVGGLARFSAFDSAVLLGANIITSLATELLVMPILFFWLPRVVQQEQARRKTD